MGGMMSVQKEARFATFQSDQWDAGNKSSMAAASMQLWIKITNRYEHVIREINATFERSNHSGVQFCSI